MSERIRIGGSTLVFGLPPGGYGARMFHLAGQRRVEGVINFDDSKQGPPGHAHGGAVTTILDEAMGASAWASGIPVLAVNLNVNLKNSAPLGIDIQVMGWVERVEGRKVFTSGEMRLPNGGLIASSTGVFVHVPDFDMSLHPFLPLQDQD